MYSRTKRGFTLVELMVVIGILGLLVGVLAITVFSKIGTAKYHLETKQLADLQQALEGSSTDNRNKKVFVAMQEKSGRAFWESCFKRQILDRDLLGKLVSLNSKVDTTADSAFIDDDGELGENNCSYTSPKGRDLLATMNLRGSKKCAVITFDSRNWNNYEERGVVVVWSEGGTPDYIDTATALETYRLSKDEWSHPAKLYGQKKPFHLTFEEKK